MPIIFALSVFTHLLLLIDSFVVFLFRSFLFNYKKFRWRVFSRCGVLLLLLPIFIVCISKWRTKILDILWLWFTHISLSTHTDTYRFYLPFFSQNLLFLKKK